MALNQKAKKKKEEKSEVLMHANELLESRNKFIKAYAKELINTQNQDKNKEHVAEAKYKIRFRRQNKTNE